jgi:hypothetical protein
MKLHFNIVDAPNQLPTHTIMDLCDYLTKHVLEPFLSRDGRPWDSRFMNFFVLDNSCDPMESVGVLQIAVHPYFTGRTSQLAEEIATQLFELGIRIGPIRYEPCERCLGREVMVLPITENPTALIAPPAVNIGYARAQVVLRDLLGYRPVEGRFVFESSDLLNRVSSVTNEQIAATVSSPVKVGRDLRRDPSPAGVRAINRCLEEIRSFAQWAASHNYSQLSAA